MVQTLPRHRKTQGNMQFHRSVYKLESVIMMISKGEMNERRKIRRKKNIENLFDR